MARGFASDNTAPVHPKVLEALARVNEGPARAYGGDEHTAKAIDWFHDQFGGDAHVSLVWNGTGANVVALRAMTRPYHAIICTEHAHINVDECGAPELLTGCKLIDLPTPDAKLTPAQVRAAIKDVGDEHKVQARVLALTQTSEYGTVYSVDELGALCDAAHALGLLVHLDGSRIANAAASLGVSLRAITRDVGVDVLSFGATKNGAMGAEAVVVFNAALASEMKYLRKQSAQLASKMRYLAAQFLALAEGDLWLANARNANAMAQLLLEGLKGTTVKVTQKVQSSAVFAMLDADAVKALQRDFHFYVWNEATGEVRWMTSWATAVEDVAEFVAAITSHCAGRI